MSQPEVMRIPTVQIVIPKIIQPPIPSVLPQQIRTPLTIRPQISQQIEIPRIISPIIIPPKISPSIVISPTVMSPRIKPVIVPPVITSQGIKPVIVPPITISPIIPPITISPIIPPIIISPIIPSVISTPEIKPVIVPSITTLPIISPKISPKILIPEMKPVIVPPVILTPKIPSVTTPKIIPVTVPQVVTIPTPIITSKVPSPVLIPNIEPVITVTEPLQMEENPPNLTYPVKSRYSAKYITYLRNLIHDTISRRYLSNNPNFEMTPQYILQPMFNLYDELFFRKQLSEIMKKDNIQLIMRFNNKLTKTGGYCSVEKCIYTIELSQPVILNTFRSGEKSHTSGGLQCYDRLGCMMNIFEHELIHFIIGIMHGHIKKDPVYKSHGAYFIQLMNSYFGHTEYKHALHRETIYNPGKREDFKVGDIVTFESKTGETVTGIIGKLNPVYAVVGDRLVKYRILRFATKDEIEGIGGIKEIREIKEVKEGFRIGDVISYTIKGKTDTGIIKNVNPKTYTIGDYRIAKEIVRAATENEKNRFLATNIVRKEKTRDDFYLGQSVKFTSSKTGEVIRGTIQKLNPTRAVIGQYTAPYNMLSPA